MEEVSPDPERRGWLKVVGAGIRIGQLTLEAQQAIEQADVVFGLVSNMLAWEMLRFYNSNLVDLGRHYAKGKERLTTYREMTDEVLAAVRAERQVSFAIYGNPAVFAYPSRRAIEVARQEGYDVELLPGISAEDSLFCDLEIDPAVHGCQIYCATAFVRDDRIFDPRSVLTLWQVSIIGESRLMDEGDAGYHQRLCDKLETAYGPSHPAILYEATTNRFCGPEMRSITVGDLRTTKVRPCCTVVIPPIDCPDLVRVPLSSEPMQWIPWPLAPTRRN